MNILLFLLTGLLAGFFAEKVTGSSMGRLANLSVGVAGAFIGGFLFGPLGLAARGLVGSLVTTTVGAIALLLVVGFIQRKT
jgi:uncharacterized membrane protein YeaQ/YmgE (transglycosylase-associated protein family)